MRWRIGAVIGVLLIARLAGAQVITGSVIGTVQDGSGAVLPGATVILTSPALPGGPATAVSDSRGQYRFTDLPPGTYRLTVTLDGFARYEELDLRVVVNTTIERIVSLPLATVNETVTVSGQSPLVDTRRSGTTATVSQEAVERIPNRRFSPMEYATWTPGVASSSPGGTGGGFTALGSSGGENTVIYDGLNLAGASGSAYVVLDSDMVEEAEVTTLGASAEYSHAQGGVMSMISKSGTNRWRGDAAAFFGPDSWTSKPVKLPCNCSVGESGFTRQKYNDYSVHGGGPIRKDRLWFFAGNRYYGESLANPGVDPEPVFPYWYNSDFFKLTWQTTSASRVTVNYNDEWWDWTNRATVTRPRSTTTDYNGWRPQWGVDFTTILTNTTTFNTVVGAWYANNESEQSVTGDNDTPFRTDSLTGLSSGGPPTVTIRQKQSLPLEFRTKLTRYAQNFLGSEHQFKVGLQAETTAEDRAYRLPGGANFSDLGGQPNEMSVRAPFLYGGIRWEVGVFGEDQITIKRRLTLSLGGRYDHMRAISPDLRAVDAAGTELDNMVNGLGTVYTWNVVSPRLGFNLKLAEDGKTVVRGSFGRSYARIYPRTLGDVHPGQSPITLMRFNAATGGYTTLVSVTHPTANIAIDSNMKPNYTDTYSVGIDRELMPNVGLSATYTHKDGRNLIGWRDIGGIYGTSVATLPDGQTLTTYPLLNNAASRRFLQTNIGNGLFTRYDGVILALNKRWSSRWLANVSYAWSKADGLLTSGTNGRDPNDYTNATGRINTDRPHLFKLQASWEIPRVDVLLGSSLSAQSGLPFAPQTTVRLPQGTRSINIDVPGSFRYPSIEVLQFRVSKIFRFGINRRIEVVADMQNLLQDIAYLSVASQNVFAGNFNQGITFIEPRKLLVGVKTVF